MHQSSVKALKRQNGFSIVSTLLLIAVASLLFAGYIRLYLNSKESLTEANFNNISYSPYFSWLFFNNHTHELGFYPFDSAVINKPFEGIAPLFAPRSKLIKVTDGNINGSDTFTLQYEGNNAGNVFNCQGTPLMANQQTESFYYINDEHDLVCSTRNQESSLEKAYPVMKNVESMIIRLGEDLDNDGLVNRYVAADGSTVSYDKVVSLRVSLLLRANETSKLLTANQYYNLDGEEKGPYSDSYIRKVLTTTIPLKKRTDQ
jgi:hypothetical protein